MSTSQKVLTELRGLAADTEELIKQVADQSGAAILGLIAGALLARR